MSDEIELVVQPRERAGKGSSRAARRAGDIPAVIYGNKKEPVMVTIRRNEIMRLLYKGAFVNKLFNVTTDGNTDRVLVRDLQTDPVTDEPVHVDLLRLSKGAVVVFEVPVHFEGEEQSPGIKKGGVLNVILHTIEIRCRAKDLPNNITIDLSKLEIGDNIHAHDLILPEGTALANERDFTVAAIAAPTVDRQSDEDEAEAAEDQAEAAEDKAEEGED